MLTPRSATLNYGMGLFVTTYRGHKYVQHGGNLDGFSLLISFLPDDNIGSVILLNMDGSSLREVLAYNINDRLLGLNQLDWNKRQLDRYLAFKKSSDEARDKNYVPRRENTRFSHPIDEYVGEYSNPAYGIVAIERAGNEHDLKVIVSHHAVHRSSTGTTTSGGFLTTRSTCCRKPRSCLIPTGTGNIASLSCSLEPNVKDIVFTRLPDRRMRERSFLEPIAGVYQVADFKYLVTLRPDNVLTVALPNGKVWELDPVRGNTFAVKGENDLTLDFKRNPGGQVTEFSLDHAGSSQIYKKMQ